MTTTTIHGQSAEAKGADAQEMFAAAVQVIADRHPELFATAEWVPPNAGGLPSVTLVGVVPPPVLAPLRGLPFDVAARSGANANADQLRDLSVAVIHGVVDATSSDRTVTSMIDSDTLGLRIEYGESSSLEDADGGAVTPKSSRAPEQVLAEVLRGLGVDEVPVPIQIKAPGRPDVATLEATVRGGMGLTQSAGGADVCTSGFAATRGTATGVITADHCPNALLYQGTAGVTGFTAESPQYSSVDFSYYYDVQFHTTQSGNTTSPSFRMTTSGPTTTVTGVSDPVTGEQVCHYGVVSGEKCGTVYATSMCIFFPSPARGTYCRLAATRTYISAGGDSGGPWFSGGVAKGTHTGVATIDNVQRSVFTAASAANCLSATLMKG